MTPYFEDIRTRLEKATPGPWEIESHTDRSHWCSTLDGWMAGSLNDIEFITHAPSDIMKLLKAVDLAVECLEKIQSGLTTDINSVEPMTKRLAYEYLVEIRALEKIKELDRGGV